MKTIQTPVYNYDELNDKAKANARQWYLEASSGDSFSWEHIQDDAKNIGLIIRSLDDHRANTGSFADSALATARAVVAEHGETCPTYKTAKGFLMSLDSLNVEYPEDADGERDSEYSAELETLEAEFLQAILEDYRIVLRNEEDYQASEEAVAEMIEANEYTFTKDGQRFG